MFGSDILEVAIGMAFLFLFMSTIASALRETIEAKMQHRAADLERGISEMLRTNDGTNWVEKFYNHPLVSSLYKETYVPNGKLMPAYIPKENFSLAILDLARAANQAGNILSLKALSDKLAAKSNLDPVQRVVLTALAAGNNDIAAVRKELEDWYDGTMDRVSSWYAKRTGVILFVLGFGAAVFLNVDAITVAKRLMVDPQLRQSIVAKAEKVVPQNPAAQPAPQDGEKPGDQPEKAADKQNKSLSELRTEFAEIGYPMGWATANGYWYPAPQACKTVPSAQGSTEYKCDLRDDAYPAMLFEAAVGWLITAMAIMLGAPFWFNLLNKLISMRSSLKPPEDKPAPIMTVAAPVMTVAAPAAAPVVPVAPAPSVVANQGGGAGGG